MGSVWVGVGLVLCALRVALVVGVVTDALCPLALLEVEVVAGGVGV